MIGRRLMAVSIAALGLAAACGGVAPSSASPDSSPVESPNPGTSLPHLPPLDPDAVGLTCGDEHVFHPALLEQPGRAETDGDLGAAALREHLLGPDGAGAPRSGWVRVAQTADRVQFMAPASRGGWTVVGFAVRDGSWTLDLAGECQPEVVLPPGVSRAEWRLDPAFPVPAAADRTIHVLLTERACASGQSPEGRVLPPVLTPTDEAVAISLLVRSQVGGADCQGNPEFPLAIELPEPLAGRALYDGAVFPPLGPLGAYELACGPMDVRECGRLAADAVRAIEGEPGGARVVSVEILDAAGSYTIRMDDGSDVTRIVN